MDGKYLTPQMRVSSAFTLAGAACVFITYWKAPKLHKQIYVRLVVNATICSGCAAVAFMEGPHIANDSFACWFQGLVANYFTLASVFWTVAVTHQLYALIHDPNLSLAGGAVGNGWICSSVCWGLPLLCTLLPLMTNDYGKYKDQGLCFVSNRSDSPSWGIAVWTFGALYGWVWASILSILGMLASIVLHLRSQSHGAGSAVTGLVNIVAAYPLTLVLCWSFHTAHRLVELFELGEVPAIVVILGNVLPILQGFFYAAVLMSTNRDFRASFLALLGMGPRAGAAEGLVLSTLSGQERSDAPSPDCDTADRPTSTSTAERGLGFTGRMSDVTDTFVDDMRPTNFSDIA